MNNATGKLTITTSIYSYNTQTTNRMCKKLHKTKQQWAETSDWKN